MTKGSAHPTEIAAAHRAAFFWSGVVCVGEVIAAVGDVEDDFFFKGGGFEFIGHALGFVKVDVEFADEACLFAREGFVTLGDDIGGAGVAKDGLVDLCAEAVMDEVNGDLLPRGVAFAPTFGSVRASLCGNGQTLFGERWGEFAVDFQCNFCHGEF